ncbi:MAG: SDR family oxidoreductase [Nitrospirae bacterium]|nr:SDR family oxidoreductase [Nitrospirota bacterium]MBI5696147.1 SDR family oxidoreductase [Nitrospirota bacterium]
MPKTALVTGGSGAVGGAVVRAFAREGYSVAFTYRNGEEAARQLEAVTGALAFKAELTKGAGVARLVEDVTGRFGGIDVLVNTVGRTQVMPFALIEEEDWDEVIAANLKPMFLASKEAARSMISRRSGVIINIGSIAGHRLLEVPVHYAAAKAAVSGFTTALAMELARFGIRVNEIVPGLLSKGVGTLVPEKEMKEYLNYCTAGRPGEPEEVAEVALFLASDRASYINAQSIHVNGGI